MCKRRLYTVGGTECVNVEDYTIYCRTILMDWLMNLLTDLEDYITFQVQLNTKMLNVDNTIKHYTCLQ